MEEKLFGRIICPLCKGKIKRIQNEIHCIKCGQIYRFFDDIPNFLPESLIEKYNSELKQQDLIEERNFYEDMYKDLKGIDDGHCVVYGYDEIYDFMNDIPKGSLLDIGCGAGHHSKDLAQRGYNVTGIDISPNGLRQAVKIRDINNLSIDFILGDIENIPFDDNVFDIAFCSLILHHFPKREKLLREIARVTKKYFVTFEVNSLDPISFIRFDIINPIIGIKNITKNQRTVSPIKLKKELKKLGFDYINTKFIDVHYNIGANPNSIKSLIINTLKYFNILLPYKSRYNKFVLKCKKG